MKKFLLFAAAALALSANAENKVLWASEDPEGEYPGAWALIYSIPAEQTATLKMGDIITVTVTKTIDEGWPQVALFEEGVGWPPFVNAGVGGKSEYPYVAQFPITGVELEYAAKGGIDIKGEGAYVSEIGLITSDKEFDPNTVWFGPKVCNWGDPVTISNEVFANVVPGDKIVVEYDKSAEAHTLQFLFGGWSGANFPTYQAEEIPFMTIDEEAGTITLDLTADLSDIEWGEKTYDLFADLKAGGLLMQGPCTVDAVLYIQATSGVEEAVAPVENGRTVVYNLLGVKVLDTDDASQLKALKKGIYIVNGKKVVL